MFKHRYIDGYTEIASFFISQKKARTKMCILLVILMVVAGIITLIVVLTNKWSNNLNY